MIERIRQIQPVYRYVAVVTAVGLTLLTVILLNSIRIAEYGSLHFWVFAGCVLVGELILIRVPRRTEVLSITASGTFTFALLVSHGVGAAVVAQMAASIIDDLLHKKSPWKILFNVAQYTLAISAGGVVLNILTELPRANGAFEVGELPGMMVAGMAVFTANTFITGAGLALAERAPVARAVTTNFRLQVATDCVMLALSPVVLAVANYSLALIPLLGVPVIAVYQSATASLKNIDLAESLKSLYETTRMAYGSARFGESLRDLLSQARDMFHAEEARIVLLSEDLSEAAAVTILRGDDYRYMEPLDLDPTEGVWARVISEGEGILIAHPIENPKLQAYFGNLGVRDAMVAPLHGTDSVIGYIQVANRLSELSTFSEEDLKLVETLANHAGVSLENARLVEKLEESLAHLTEMNRLKDDFVASVSHELRTPLTSIRGYVRTLLRPDVEFSKEDQKSFLETIDRQSTRLHRLIEDLLAVSRIESEADPALLTEVSVPRLIDNVIDEIRSRVEPDKITIDVAPDLPVVETDEGKLHQVVSNLVENAVKYGGKENPIRIVVHMEAEGVTVSIVDRGPGIPPELGDKVFDRFYQVDQSATRSVGGTGLGLYICRRMAEAIGGRVWLEASSSEGSTFSVWVPLAPPAQVSSPTRMHTELTRKF